MKFLNSAKSRDKFAGKILKGSFTAAFVILGVLFIFRLVVPSTHGGWSVIPTVDYILIFGFILCFLCMAGTYGFQAWTKSKDEYYDWLVSLGLLRTAYSRFVSNLYPKWMYLWLARLAPIIVTLVLGAVVVLIIVFSPGSRP